MAAYHVRVEQRADIVQVTKPTDKHWNRSTNDVIKQLVYENNECRQSRKRQKRRKNVQTTTTDQHAQRRKQHFVVP